MIPKLSEKYKNKEIIEIIGVVFKHSVWGKDGFWILDCTNFRERSKNFPSKKVDLYG